ncbi:Exodeoxyribonuclease V gamma chain [Alloalcanivorax xenomutans]|uniref:exodeoxyribonuclease V subunit gamma n=1 Tax=Alloalcanivorax xenomutans TaxID=1094342 RepID=UPI0006D5BE6A|nr:exodeoxyribonuclease V subunit gamma [Alloalcanivorax xenomutans]PHS60780.1 MAG: exodeoxyribonuclease V subunit gamma [Alcanivorax sp.]CUR45454.1 Exodeoxyribonuclease V gamma chain [Alloalcanivorax xenomutans]
MQNGLMVLHSNRLETLTDLLIEWLGRYPLAPLETETVLVQSNGMAQWLKLKLAAPDALGIAAGTRFQMPARFLWSAYRTVLGEDRVPRTSPFDKSRLLWRLYRLLPILLDDDRFGPLRHFLADDTDGRKRHQLAERLADLYDAYQVYRADWLADWEQGEDRLRRSDERALFDDFPESQRWQAHLWRAVLADMNETQTALSRSAIHNAFVSALRNGECPPGLPRRLVIFGISALPQQGLEALAALSSHCQILMLVQNPCRHYWADIVEDRHLLRRQLEHRKRHLTALPENRVNPLLAAWGKQGRDFIGLLYDHDDPDSYRAAFHNQIDLFEDSEPETLLQQLQHDILELEPLPERDQRPALRADDSLQFRIAHSAQREVEILQDALLERFAHDPDLKPRDVIVMVPDIEAYAPHIDAVFGRLDPGDPRYLPYTLSDRSAGAASPLALAVEAVLHLPQWRFTASDILDLLDVPAARRRFGIEESALPQLTQWIEQARIRWGLDAEQRHSLDVPGFEQNSWAFGLKRMLAGYLLGDAPAWRGIEPLDEVAGLGAELAGRLARLLDTLQRHWRAMREPADVQQWQARFTALLDDLFAPDSAEDQALDAGLRDALSDWLAACEEADFAGPLPLTVARRPLLDALNAESLSQRFMAGRINFCTLMPMRAIPFRHVCLLGMKDGDYPRQQQPMDFDLMRQWGRYRPGDRSRRDDDRYLFLEALLSARDGLYISWTGRNVRDNSERPPSVLVAQLRDYLNQRWRSADNGRDVADQLTVQHPLQPFSRRYFDADDNLTTYADEWRPLHAHDETTGEDNPLPLPPLENNEPVSCAALGRFLKQPVAHFFEQRLKAQLRQDSHNLDDTEPFSVQGLERWQLQDQLLGEALRAGPDQAGEAMRATLERLAGSGALPLAPFTEGSRATLLMPLRRPLQQYFLLLAQSGALQPQQEIQLDAGGLPLEDWLVDLRGEASQPRRLVLKTSRLQGSLEKLTTDWVIHLAACASGHALTTQIQGQDGLYSLAPMDPATARERLDAIGRAWQQALCEPLPIACATAFAWLAGEEKDKGEAEARKVFEPGFNSDGEQFREPAIARAWSGFDAMLAVRHDDKPAFCHWTEQLYAPLYQQAQWTEQGGPVA